MYVYIEDIFIYMYPNKQDTAIFSQVFAVVGKKIWNEWELYLIAHK